jgi:hypothetical protein
MGAKAKQVLRELLQRQRCASFCCSRHCYSARRRVWRQMRRLGIAVFLGGLSSGDASKYFAFGHEQEEGAEKKQKKIRRQGKGEGSDGDVERKQKKVKE